MYTQRNLDYEAQECQINLSNTEFWTIKNFDLSNFELPKAHCFYKIVTSTKVNNYLSVIIIKSYMGYLIEIAKILRDARRI